MTTARMMLAVRDILGGCVRGLSRARIADRYTLIAGLMCCLEDLITEHAHALITNQDEDAGFEYLEFKQAIKELSDLRDEGIRAVFARLEADREARPAHVPQAETMN